MAKGKFFFGALLGAAAAALLTPVAGKKARQKLQKTAQKVKQDDTVSQVMEKGSQVFDKVKQEAEQRMKKAKKENKEK